MSSFWGDVAEMVRLFGCLSVFLGASLAFGQQSSQTAAANADSGYEEESDDLLEPAAVQLDVSHASPLIKVLYQATRETKDGPTLQRLAETKHLIETNTDISAVDPQGRTALHWAVFGSSYASKAATLVAYEVVARAMIERGAEINRQDIYNNTALDYLLYSPNFEMQTLLLEHGATSGVLPTVFQSQTQLTRGALRPGQTISVRLDLPLYSDRSRTGDPITGTVTYPLCVNGELIACKERELLLPPGIKVNGTVLFAQKAPDKYSRPRLVLDFSNIVHGTGLSTPLYSRVLNIDNARETVRNNEILGIIQPHAASKMSMLMSAVSAVHPAASYTIKGVQAVYGLSIRREILFPAGTDLQLQVVGASTLKVNESWPGWKQLPVTPELKALAAAAPLRTHAKDGTLSDITNLLFLGSREQLVAAFGEAGWFEADDLNIRSGAKTVGATIRQTGYTTAPVSTLMINGQPPDFAFQKSLDTFAKRHHLRIWKQTGTYNGKEVWLGAATHDIAISKARGGTKWSHRIDPHIDRERDWVETDLL
ncbi:MAG: LssY C-terminal domain-containing protein [Bryobacteraceae bacterium]